MNASCGEEDGSATIVLTQDPSNYEFTWEPSVSTTNVATDLGVGVYNVIVSVPGAIDCVDSTTIVITNSDLDAPTIANQTSADCGQSNGTATLEPSTLMYTWSDAGVGANRTDLAAGSYTVTATDGICEQIITVEIGENSNLVATANISIEPDCQTANGVVAINVTGGSGNYSYDWPTGLDLSLIHI